MRPDVLLMACGARYHTTGGDAFTLSSFIWHPCLPRGKSVAPQFWLFDHFQFQWRHQHTDRYYHAASLIAVVGVYIFAPAHAIIHDFGSNIHMVAAARSLAPVVALNVTPILMDFWCILRPLLTTGCEPFAGWNGMAPLKLGWSMFLRHLISLFKSRRLAREGGRPLHLIFYRQQPPRFIFAFKQQVHAKLVPTTAARGVATASAWRITHTADFTPAWWFRTRALARWHGGNSCAVVQRLLEIPLFCRVCCQGVECWICCPAMDPCH